MTLERAAPYRFDSVQSGVRIVISDALPVSAGLRFEQWLKAAVGDVRPALEAVRPAGGRDDGGRGGGNAVATTAGDAAIVVWCRRKLWYSRGHPEVTVHTLEHEAAHVLSIRTGVPGDEDWEAVMREDSADQRCTARGCLALPISRTRTTRPDSIREDRAYSVEGSRAVSFAARFPARSRRINEVLSGNSSAETGQR